MKVHLSEELVDGSGNIWGAGRESLLSSLHEESTKPLTGRLIARLRKGSGRVGQSRVRVLGKP